MPDKRFDGIGLVAGNYPSKDIGEKIFGAENTIQQQMNVEAALARVQASLGIIPKEAAEEITRKCDVSLIDEAEFVKQHQITNHPIMPLIRCYAAICDGKAGEYIHYGTTTQDISDTALVIQLKQAYEVIYQKTIRVRDIIAKRARENRDNVMMGRTNDQQALPITLGFKMASWVDELNRSIERMEQAKDRLFVGQFAGAVGTLASLGEDGLAIQEGLMKELGLGVPDTAWYAARDRFAELVSILSILTCSLGRYGNEVYNEQRSEVNELAEGFIPGRVGSSTMPHKRNPFVSGQLAAYGREARTLTTEMLTTMEATNERDCRTLFMENDILARAYLIADSALDTAEDLFSHMEIHQNGIQRNLDLLGGLVFSEALMMRLSKDLGRQTSHEIIYELAQKAIGENRNFRELVKNDPVVSQHISAEEVDEIMEPSHYIGLSGYFTDKVCGKDKE